ncbi:MAG: MerR family DNA-binding transcriptional regulator [Streptosporangiales bacterium]|nr:MerR family DNA-binding transcriptional regulator [Streptosporangiales bacterium]
MTGAGPRTSAIGQRTDGEHPDARGLMSIGSLARVTGVSSRTIRYYEELGILPAPKRSPGGTRKYPEEYRLYIEGALALKELGFSLEEIKLLGGLALGRRIPAEHRQQVADVVWEKVQRLEHKIKVLRQLYDMLDEADEELTGAPSAPHPLRALLQEERPPLAS